MLLTQHWGSLALLTPMLCLFLAYVHLCFAGYRSMLFTPCPQTLVPPPLSCNGLSLMVLQSAFAVWCAAQLTCFGTRVAATVANFLINLQLYLVKTQTRPTPLPVNLSQGDIAGF